MGLTYARTNFRELENFVFREDLFSRMSCFAIFREDLLSRICYAENFLKGELRAKFHPNFFFHISICLCILCRAKFYHFWKRFPEVMTFLSFQDINKRDVTNAER